jgi:hypothetical protein
MTVVGDVVADRLGERWVDRANLGDDFVAVEVKVVGVNELQFVGLPGFPQIRDDHAHQADQATGLLETGVFLEAGIQIAQPKVERIRLRQLCGKRIRRVIGDIHFPRRFDRRA